MALTGQYKARYCTNSTGATLDVGTAILVTNGAAAIATTAGTKPNTDYSGFVQEDIADGDRGKYAYKEGDTCKGKAGGTVTEGNLLTLTTAGTLKNITAAGIYVAKAEETASSGEKFRMTIITGTYDI